MWGRVAIAGLLVGNLAHADVDWARGLVTAEGIGVASRAAPTPAAARGPARRMAEDAARKKVAAQLDALPVAGGGTFGKKAKDKGAVAQAVAHAIVVEAEPETDGSWKVRMGVPIEALRQVLAGGARAAEDDDKAPAVVVVASEGAAKIKPAIGYTVGGLRAATVFVKEVPAWAKDAPRVKAKGVKGGAIDVELPAGASAATLFVVQ